MEPSRNVWWVVHDNIVNRVCCIWIRYLWNRWNKVVPIATGDEDDNTPFRFIFDFSIACRRNSAWSVRWSSFAGYSIIEGIVLLFLSHSICPDPCIACSISLPCSLKSLSASPSLSWSIWYPGWTRSSSSSWQSSVFVLQCSSYSTVILDLTPSKNSSTACSALLIWSHFVARTWSPAPTRGTPISIITPPLAAAMLAFWKNFVRVVVDDSSNDKDEGEQDNDDDNDIRHFLDHSMTMNSWSYYLPRILPTLYLPACSCFHHRYHYCTHPNHVDD